MNRDNVVEGNRLVQELSVTKYDGNAALISNNELIFPIVRSSATGYTNKVGEPIDADKTWTFGEQGYLAVGFEALNNARLVWVGSNSLLAEPQLYKWCFQQQGKLKLQFVEHIKADEPSKPNPHLYRIKDQAIYTIGYLNLSMESGSHLRLKTKRSITIVFQDVGSLPKIKLETAWPSECHQ